MANLSHIEMQKLESLLSMGAGYVLNFTTQNFERFVKSIVDRDISLTKYERYGTSKAKRLRAFWEIEGDKTVGKLIEELVNYYHAQIELGKIDITKVSEKIANDCLETAYKLQDKGNKDATTGAIEDVFLSKEFDELPLSLFNLPPLVIPIIEQRIVELKKCLKNGASLSVLFLAGSLLEGILLNIASQNPVKFNQANSSPKDKNGKSKSFPEWSLNSLIEVSYELDYLSLDVKKHSHALRDFRNYIHPFQQMSSGFFPDSHTAEISWKVLKAAMYQIHKKLKQ